MNEEEQPENMPDEASGDIPPSDEDSATTGPLRILENGGDRFRNVLRLTFAALLGILMMTNVAIYSLYQSLRSRVDYQDHRLERLNKMMTDMLAANQNAHKIERIEQQVTGIEGQVTDLTNTIKAQDAAEDAMADAEQAKKNKKRRK